MHTVFIICAVAGAAGEFLSAAVHVELEDSFHVFTVACALLAIATK